MLSFVNDFPGKRSLIHVEEENIDDLIIKDRFKISGKADIDEIPVTLNNCPSRVILDIIMTGSVDGEPGDVNIATLSNCVVAKSNGHIVITFTGGGGGN